MAFSTADLAAVEAAIASGELTVQFADRKVQYRDMDELMKARAMISKSINDAAGKRRPRQFRVNVSKGV